MKKAGDILSALFDERFLKTAQGYSKFFNSWADITAKNRIAAAADHSRIKDLDRGIILIETDHPGWKQILQTKQSKLLNDFRRRFPELDISGISFMLGTCSAASSTPDKTHSTPEREEYAAETSCNEISRANPAAADPSLAHQTNSETFCTQEPAAIEKLAAVPPAAGLDAIKDEEFREKLRRLEKAVADRSKK